MNVVGRFKLLDYPYFTPESRADTLAAARKNFNEKWAEHGGEVEEVQQAVVQEPCKRLPDNKMTGRRSIGKMLARSRAATQASVAPQPQADELTRYLALPQELDGDLCVLQWWKERELQFPNLSRMARQFLGVPATSAAAERVFSKAGRLHDDFRKRTKESTLEQTLLVAVNYNE